MTRLHRFHHFSDIRHAVIVSIVLIDQIHHNLRHHVFSSVRLSAIISVRATSVLLSKRREPSAR